MLGQPDECSGVQIDGVQLSGELAGAVEDEQEYVEVGSDMRADGGARVQSDDVGVKVAAAHLQFPHGARGVRRTVTNDGGGVAQDAGERGGGELAEPDPPRLRTLVEIFPAVAASVI